jgi:molybdenum cofactor cytidylyltransferase
MHGSRVGAVVLAAGASSRLGTPKQLVQLRGESLLRRAARAALTAGCTPVVVVTGANAEPSRMELSEFDVREVFNGDWRSGLASSIRAGVEALVVADADVDAAVLMVCDQPRATADVVSALIAAHHVSGNPIVASAYRDSVGVPALFGRALFAELVQLEGEGGAKRFIERHASEAYMVPFPGGAVDVDTLADVAALAITPAADPL